MINQRALESVQSATCGPGGLFRRPLYDSYCFARLPATIEFLLTGDEEGPRERALPADVLGPFHRQYQTVVLMLVDGFGWQLFQRHADRFPFLRRFVDQGVASPITSQFPSTTAAHMTTLHTGEPLARTGVWEWYYYEPVLDAVWAPLLYSIAGDHDRETLRNRSPSVDVESILPGPRWYRQLAEKNGIRSTVFQHEEYAHSTYSTIMFDGATRRGYHTTTAGLIELADRIRTEKGPRYYFFYIDGIDARSHSHGLGSQAFNSQVESTFSRLEEHFFQPLAGKVDDGDALLLMSADHGQVPVNVSPPAYVNLLWPDLVKCLRTSRDGGEPIRFAGSPRDLFLYVKDEQLDEVERTMRELLAGRAEVWRTEEMLKGGLFGPSPSERLLARLGNLALLPYAGQSVYWFEEGKFWMKHIGSHGGLTPQEMDTGVYAVQL
jgi:hypothetical protein